MVFLKFEISLHFLYFLTFDSPIIIILNSIEVTRHYINPVHLMQFALTLHHECAEENGDHVHLYLSTLSLADFDQPGYGGRF